RRTMQYKDDPVMQSLKEFCAQEGMAVLPLSSTALVIGVPDPEVPETGTVRRYDREKMTLIEEFACNRTTQAMVEKLEAQFPGIRKEFAPLQRLYQIVEFVLEHASTP